ncbi:retrotransposon protein [Striga asiatica]|uniref:Retrotransposon protein n=1 Tax=Striga asiatica TaxID=4170 RepID=A0A5A7PKI8_STRAF|nr:retrotransposon protein [Striga asiatica]
MPTSVHDDEESVRISNRRSSSVERINTSRGDMGGSTRQEKAYAHRAYSSGHQINRAETKVRPPMVTNAIIFSDEDSQTFDNPHSDAIVITTPIMYIPIHRILVDTGAYSSVLYWSAFLKMGIDRNDLDTCSDRITGFDGKTTVPEWRITLSIEVRGTSPTGRTILETFKVVKMNNEYNAILGRTAL